MRWWSELKKSLWPKAMTRIYQMNSAEKRTNYNNNAHRMEQTNSPNDELCMHIEKMKEIRGAICIRSNNAVRVRWRRKVQFRFIVSTFFFSRKLQAIEIVMY